jgi:nucleotidyltransferase/DNA polymerase involved in DNA repair
MPYAIKEIEGIGPAYAEKLNATGIKTTEDLLKKCGTPGGRRAVAETTGLGEAVILKWTNRADLMRISGIGPQFSELLEVAGVDTIKELRTRNAANLAVTMAESNAQKQVARTSPAAKTVEKWVAAAQKMDPRITY